jgi:hypothetical protein
MIPSVGKRRGTFLLGKLYQDGGKAARNIRAAGRGPGSTTAVPPPTVSSQ